MIQFNLLPDVKKEYIKARRTKRLIVTVSLLSGASAITIVLLLLSFVHVVQKKHITDLTTDIGKEISAINSIQDLGKILTIQKQLDTLPELHESRPKTSRLFGYLVQVTPSLVKIRSVNLDLENATLSIEGSADSLATINQYVDTLKFATFTTADIDDGIPFSNVVSQLSRNEDTATYEIVMFFDDILFDNTEDVKLVVPNQITTRSIVGRPSLDNQENNLFEDNPVEGGQ